MNDSDNTIDVLDVTTEDTITIDVPYNYDDYDSYTVTGTSGQTYTTGTSGTYTFNTADLTWANDTDVTSSGIQIRGEKGTWDVENRIRDIERILNIPERDYDMEAQHPELTALYEKHMRKIEKVLKKLPTVSEYEREVEKCRMWDTLKGPDRNINGGP